MIAVITSTVLPLLFIATGMFGTAVLVGTWRQHAGTLARLRAELALCEAGGCLAGTAALPALRSAPRPVAVQALRPAVSSAPRYALTLAA